MPDLKFHPAADIFPLMTDGDFDELVEDIRKFGLREPIAIFDGLILDGRNRYRACLLAGVKCKTAVVETDDPVAYVLSLNKHRRHLTVTQLSMAAAKARAFYDEQAKERMLAGKKADPMEDLPQGTARDAVGKAFGVSGKAVDQATHVLRSGTPELVEAVEQDRIAVSTASRVSSRSPEEQRRVLENCTKGKRRPRPAENDEADDDSAPIIGYEKTARFALECARCAITQLERIKRNNPGRDEAFTKVEKWLQSQRKKT